MEALQRFIHAFLGLGVGLTAVRLATDRGGGRFAFTLSALLLVVAAAPYLVAMAAMRRVPPRWALAVALATCLFGAADAALRMKAFYFATSTADGAMAIWLPLYSLAVIPGLAIVAYACIAIVDRTGFRPG